MLLLYRMCRLESFWMTRQCNALQGLAAGKPAVLPIVVYDLPSRDCAALASNGELAVGDLPQYKTKCAMEVFATRIPTAHISYWLCH